jgi:signal transduction histidine kinase/CheY-like chemotaxis protein
VTVAAESAWPVAGGEAGRRMRFEDWSAGPLGPVDTWPQPLRTAIEVVLSAHHPMLVAWGHDYLGFHNDALTALLGRESPARLGRPCLEQCAELSPELVTALERAYSGETVRQSIDAAGEGFDVTCAPLRHRTGAVGGAFCAATALAVAAPIAASGEAAGTARPFEADRGAGPGGDAGHDLVARAEALVLQLVPTKDLRRLLQQVLLGAIELLRADFGGARFYDAETDELQLIAHSGFPPESLERFRAMSPAPGATGSELPFSLAARLGERVVVEDLETDPRFRARGETMAVAGERAVVSIPLQDISGELLAVVSVYFREAQHPSEAALTAADAYARYAAHLLAARCAERVARRREARLQCSLDAAGLGTWEWRPESDVLALDHRALAMLGEPRSPDGWPKTNADFERSIHAEDLEGRRQALARARHPDGPRRFTVQFRWLREEGRQLWLEQAGQARSELSLAGKPVSLLSGALADVTEQRSSEEALRAASVHKDRFLATLAHELRNPLAPLRYAAELLHDEDGENLSWSREVIDRQVGHLTRLIDDLFDISRITRDLLDIKKRRVELADVVQTALETCRPIILQNRQELIVQLPSEAVFVLGDPVRLTQVIVNLLKNASKFTPPEGRIEVKAAGRDGEGEVSVKDNGIGISAQDLPHIFDVFYQAKPNRAAQGGLGIGLYLAKRLVELHGGTLGARSDGPGAGSEFVVRLPAVENPEVGAGPSVGRARPAAGGRERPKCRVLVVDDDPDSADALARLLRHTASEVQIAYDGLAAVDAAEKFRPQVVLLDLDMPRLDGYETCRRLRQQPWASRISMVALSGWGRSEDRARTREAGFDGHLVKPVGRAEVEALLEQWQQSGPEAAADD